MVYAVTIEPLNAIVFVSEQPEVNPWEVQEGVALDAAPLYGTWTADRGSLEEILCVSTLEPKYFKVFRDQRDIDPTQFRLTGRHFGGIFSKPTWERFARLASTGLATLEIGIDEPVAARSPPEHSPGGPVSTRLSRRIHNMFTNEHLKAKAA